MLDKMRQYFESFLKYTVMAINPLSIYSNWCKPKCRFWGGLAYIYIYHQFSIKYKAVSASKCHSDLVSVRRLHTRYHHSKIFTYVAYLDLKYSFQ